jgi:type I restriction enzyme, S subunit
MPLVAPDHIEQKTGRLSGVTSAKDQAAISGKYLFPPGCVLYSKIRPHLRKATYVGFAGLCSADMYPLVPSPEVDGQFLLACILDEPFSRFAESVSARSGMPKINRDELAAAELLLPDLREQRAIAQALTDANSLIEGLEELIEKKRRIKEGAMQELLTGKRRLPGFGGSWVEVRLADLYDFKNGLNKAKRYFGHGSPIINYMDVFRGGIVAGSGIHGRVDVSSDERANFGVDSGDALFTRTSETREEIGLAAIVGDVAQGTVFSGFVLRARPRNDRLRPSFAAWWLRAPEIRKQIVSTASYTTRALTNGKLLGRVCSRIPKPSEQDAISGVLDAMYEDIKALEARVTKARQIKEGMIQELLSGRIRLA